MSDLVCIAAAIAAAVVTGLIAFVVGRWSRRGEVTARRDAESQVSALTERLTQVSEENDVLHHKFVELKNTNRALTQELTTLNLELDGAQIMRSDYKQLKVRSGEADRLREEVVTLRSELETSRTEEDRLIPLGEDTAARDNARSLQEAVNSLVNEHVHAATIVDDSGFPVVAAGTADDALAAFSVLIAEPCAKASSFVKMGDPYGVSLVDVDGERVSYWPFVVSGKSMALVTMSKKPPATPAVNSAISKVKALLPRSSRTLEQY